MERIVLHSDLNNFYASVERILNPELTGKPLAVCGNAEERKGIVLAKSEEAKRFGIRTGDTVWQAQKKCPNLIIVKPHFQEYMRYSRKVKAIYARYTEYIESYGIDECWLDITRFTTVFPPYVGAKTVGVGENERFSDDFLLHLGDTIRNAVKSELGLTVSVGVSFNKVFAKLGSDIKKPDGTTVISLHNFRRIVYPLPVSDLLYVGGATAQKLKDLGFSTIGKLASAPDEVIVNRLGKNGATLLTYARGRDQTPVLHMNESRELKSIGNSLTYARDLTDYDEVKKMLYVLSESVAARLRESGLGLASTVHLWVRDSNLKNYSVQKKVRHTLLCGEIATHAYQLFTTMFTPPFAVRALGVTVSGFDGEDSQLTFEEMTEGYQKREKVERCIDAIRKKHGYSAVQRGVVIVDPEEAHNDIKGTHLIKPAKFEEGELPEDFGDDLTDED